MLARSGRPEDLCIVHLLQYAIGSGQQLLCSLGRILRGLFLWRRHGELLG